MIFVMRTKPYVRDVADPVEVFCSKIEHVIEVPDEVDIMEVENSWGDWITGAHPIKESFAEYVIERFGGRKVLWFDFQEGDHVTDNWYEMRDTEEEEEPAPIQYEVPGRMAKDYASIKDGEFESKTLTFKLEKGFHGPIIRLLGKSGPTLVSYYIEDLITQEMNMWKSRISNPTSFLIIIGAPYLEADYYKFMEMVRQAKKDWEENNK